MSSKRNWNDVSDDDSQESQQQIQEEPSRQEPQETPLLNKIVSSPFPQKKALSNEQQNLKKLQDCLKQQVWLFNPLFYKDEVEQVEKILRKNQKLIKIQKFVKGWNVLTDKQEARSLIVQGKKQGKFGLRFYFSNKNDKIDQNPRKYNDRNNNNYAKNNNYDNKKIKYVAKSPNSKLQMRDLKSPESLRKIESQNDYNKESFTPKSPAYKKQGRPYQKEDAKYKDKQSKRSDSKQSNQNKISRQNEKKNYKPKYISKNSNQQKVQKKQYNEYNAQSPRKKYTSKVQEQETKIVSPSYVNKQEDQQDKNMDSNEQSDNSPTLKKPKKKKTKKTDFIKDENNPFSMLSHV